MILIKLLVFSFVSAVHQAIQADLGQGYEVIIDDNTDSTKTVDVASDTSIDAELKTAEILEVEKIVENVQESLNDIPYEDSINTVLILEQEQTFDKLYVAGVRAYDDHLWYSCASKIERAIKDYKNYKTILTNCRLDCSKGLRSSKLSNLTTNFPEYSSYVRFLTAADCFRRCKNESIKTHPKVTQQLENIFEKRKPYTYLQFCSFKLDRLSQAASAAYTYYLANPNDEDTKQNIQFYRDRAGVSEDEFIDMEMLPYKEHYIRGLFAYQNEQWKELINLIELSLEDYWKQDEKCHADCEAQGKVTGNELTTTVADLIISVLNCRLLCEDKLSIVYSEPIQFFLRDLYHYLQFAYFKVNEFEKSAEAAEAFLMFTPNHEVMRKNKVLLLKKLGHTTNDFAPRKDAAEYIKQKKEMYDFMDVIVKHYKWSDLDEGISLEEEGEMKESLDKLEDRSSEGKDDWLSRYERLGMHVIAKADDLKREERFVTDGLLREEQCEDTLGLIKESLKLPSGALEFNFKLSQKKLLENPSEEFEALLRQLIRAIEVVKHYVQVYRGSEITLFVKQTSVVCWSSSEDPETLNNCYPQEDGSCIPFQEFQDNLLSDLYSTVTYLNTVDEDGDFQFLNENGEVDSSFGVKCGRTVGFNTADRHQVKIPKKGNKRCALVVRYSTNLADEEKDLHSLLYLLHKTDELRFNKTKGNTTEVLKQFEEKGVKVVKNAKDLKGEERFLADGLATKEQCETLRNVALELGKTGDGYYGRKSPHTVNELFAGLNLIRFKKSLALLGDGYSHYTFKPSFISPHTKHELYQGITIFRANKLMHEGFVPTHGLRQYLELSEASRLFVEKYFNLTKPLYFEYTHLVCRTAVNDSNFSREDLSHPIHGDNCNLKPDGTCTKDFPAFVQRDYSALLYLNSDFEGGEFFFAHPNLTEQASVRPKCGCLVGFNAGDLHGVRAVKSGQRCALAMWYTLNPSYKELAHIQARKTLEQMEAEEQAEKKHEEL
ncbi:hypothetical protein Btru_047201 [Bulinus truncatus]|nr:hypothetical protein Btru_047201 [Bulinus truncatus]